MKGNRFLIACAVLAITASNSGLANEIYKWTDDEGNVHYEDRPTGSASEERIALSYSRTNTGAVQKRIESRAKTEATRQEARTAAAEEEKSAAAQAAEAAANEKKCESYRARLQTFVQSRRLYRENESGEREYLDDQQTQEARQRVEELISENCS